MHLPHFIDKNIFIGTVSVTFSMSHLFLCDVEEKWKKILCILRIKFTFFLCLIIFYDDLKCNTNISYSSIFGIWFTFVWYKFLTYRQNQLFYLLIFFLFEVLESIYTSQVIEFNKIIFTNLGNIWQIDVKNTRSTYLLII